MKKSLFIASVILMVFAEQGRCQPTLAQPSLPPGPLIANHMPDYAQWTIDYTYSDAPKPGADSALLTQYKKLALQDPAIAKAMANPHFIDALNPARPVHVVITKTGNIRHVERSLERGLKSELWSDAGTRIEQNANMPGPIVSMGNSVTQNEFPEFNWVSKESFTGIDTGNGHQCLVFKSQVDTLELAHPGSGGSGVTVPAIAYIDLKTRYPISLQFGVETRQFTYLAPPTAQLVLPDECAAAVKATEDRIQKATPHLSPP